MLTLLEPPGAKQHQRFQSGQYLLNLGGGAAGDDDDYDEDRVGGGPGSGGGAHALRGDDDEGSMRCCAPLEKVLDKHLVGKSSSNEYSSRWKREFRQRPSWCDADLCLQQIKRRKAKGNRWALYSRSFIQKCLFSLGSFVQEHAWSVILTLFILFGFCCYGLQYVRIETDIVKLWVAKGGRLDEELSFHTNVLNSVQYNSSKEGAAEIVRENGLGGGYQVVIQTPETKGENMLTREGLLKHVSIMEEIANITVNVHGIDWKLSDLCFKPAKPDTSDAMAQTYETVIDRIIPCIWITPIDCFWEGAKPLGPSPAVNKGSELGMLAAIGLLDHIDGVDVSWKNLNPTEIIHGINRMFSLGTYALMFDRAGIANGYLDRPCIDPLDPECPKQAPNHFETCESGIVDRWVEYMDRTGEKIELATTKEFSIFDMDFSNIFGRKKRQAVDPAAMAAADEAAAPSNSTRLEDTVPVPEGTVVEDTVAKVDAVVAETTTTISSTTTTTTTTTPAPTTMSPAQRKEYCLARHAPMLRWMARPENAAKWSEFLKENEGPTYPNYPEVMSDGCGGFARGVLQWPPDMILGKAQRNESGMLMNASALQSVFLVASPNDIYLRFKTDAAIKSKPLLTSANWTTDAAEEVIITWQRSFTQLLYKHRHNFVEENGFTTERRTIHPLASTSIADMLEEFCQFNYTIILVGYGLMLVYAMVTQLRTEACLPAAHSCMGLAFAGVVTVTFASVAGLGLATWFGIEFNAATTQIVPFLTLGIGVDNMFMLLHNYHDVVAMTSRNEMGVLLRETGMSILCTSTNNILSFLAGTLLPIPALRSFCAQSTILLTFNFIAILTIYPAVISLDLRRRKSGKRDIFCCIPDPVEENYRSKQAHPVRKPMNGEASYRNLISKTGKDIMDDVDDHNPQHHGFLEDVVPYTLHAAIRNYYIPFISNNCVKVMVIISSICLCVVAVMGMRQANIGLELSDVLPEHTAPAAFLRARDEYFSFYPMFAVLKGPHIDYPNQQQLIESYRNAIGDSKFVIKNRLGQPSEAYWLGMMRDWLLSVQNETDQAIARGLIDTEHGTLLHPKNLSDAAMTGYKLLCSHGQHYDCAARVGKIRLVDPSGVINPEGFYNYLTAWFNQDNMMYYVTQASFFPNPPSWAVNVSGVVPPAEPLAYSQIPFYLTGLTNTPVIVEVIKEIRSICDDYAAQGLPNFPQGIAFTFWEQYLHLNGNLMQAIGTIALAVFIVLSILLFNPWAAGSILVILMCMTVQLAGFLGWAGIKLNPVSAVTLITAVGIGVEFTAHVVLAFLTSLGNRQERMAAAVDRVFVPVIHGALSTLLGILMLAFSEFEFVVKYFFVVMSALIVIGLINGLILLPVLLSLVGPRTEITPLDNKRCLPLPPPIRTRPEMMDDYEDGAMCFPLEDLDMHHDGGGDVVVDSIVGMKGLTMYARRL